MQHRITYNGHVGILFTNTNRVMFYETTFDDICSAVILLRKLPPGIKYKGICHVGIRGFRLPGGGIIIDTGGDTRWFAQESGFDEYYLKNYNIYLS
jgi:hypothetical protein